MFEIIIIIIIIIVIIIIVIVIVIIIVVRFPITSPHFRFGLVRPKNCTKK